MTEALVTPELPAVLAQAVTTVLEQMRARQEVRETRVALEQTAIPETQALRATLVLEQMRARQGAPAIRVLLALMVMLVRQARQVMQELAQRLAVLAERLPTCHHRLSMQFRQHLRPPTLLR